MSNTTDPGSNTDVSSFTDLPAIADVSTYSIGSQLFLIVYLIICAIGVIGNASATFVYVGGRQLTLKPINLFFIHQAFIDLIVCAFTILTESLIKFNIDGPGICHLSTINLLLQWQLTRHPISFLFLLKSDNLLSSTRFIIILGKRLPLTFIAEWATTCLLFAGFFQLPQSTRTADASLLRDFFMNRIPLYLCILSIGILLPTMIICYARMLNVLSKAARPTDTTSVTTNSKAVPSAQINLFQTCIIMLIFFLAAWITDQSAVLLLFLGTYKSVKTTHLHSGRLMLLIASVANPYIWALFCFIFIINLCSFRVS